MTTTDIRNELLKAVTGNYLSDASEQVLVNLLEYHWGYLLQLAVENPTDPIQVGEAFISALDQEIMAYEDDNQGDD